MLKEGQKAPAFTGKDQNGNKIALKDFQGKKLVLFFYPGALTPTCTVEACNLRDHFSLLKQQGFEVVGVSPDTIEKQKRFQERNNLPYALVADEKNVLTEKYGVRAMKKMFGREYMGIIRTTFLIDEKGVIEKIFTKPKSKIHGEEILAYVKESATTKK